MSMQICPGPGEAFNEVSSYCLEKVAFSNSARRVYSAQPHQTQSMKWLSTPNHGNGVARAFPTYPCLVALAADRIYLQCKGLKNINSDGCPDFFVCMPDLAML